MSEKLRRLAKAIDEAYSVYIEARDRAVNTWREHSKAVDDAVAEAEARGLRYLSEAPDLLDRLKALEQAAVDAEAEAKAAYRDYERAWGAWRQAVKEADHE